MWIATMVASTDMPAIAGEKHIGHLSRLKRLRVIRLRPPQHEAKDAQPCELNPLPCIFRTGDLSRMKGPRTPPEGTFKDANGGVDEGSESLHRSQCTTCSPYTPKGLPSSQGADLSWSVS